MVRYIVDRKRRTVATIASIVTESVSRLSFLNLVPEVKKAAFSSKVAVML